MFYKNFYPGYFLLFSSRFILFFFVFFIFAFIINFLLFWSFFRRTAMNSYLFLSCNDILLFSRFFRFFGFFGNSRPIYKASLAVLIRIDFCMILFPSFYFLLKFYKTTVVYDFFLYLAASIIRIKPLVSDNLRYICLIFY